MLLRLGVTYVEMAWPPGTLMTWKLGNYIRWYGEEELGPCAEASGSCARRAMHSPISSHYGRKLPSIY